MRRRRGRQQQGLVALMASVALILLVVGGTLGLVAYLSASQLPAPPSVARLDAASSGGFAVAVAPTSSPRPVHAPTATAAPRVADLPTAVSAPQYAQTIPDPTRAVVHTPEASRDGDATSRFGCDPAYPEARTCIPPGPPFDQGCAITEQRLFDVLPPDPQGLDHDGDGIGCEPIGG